MSHDLGVAKTKELTKIYSSCRHPKGKISQGCATFRQNMSNKYTEMIDIFRRNLEPPSVSQIRIVSLPGSIVRSSCADALVAPVAKHIAIFASSADFNGAQPGPNLSARVYQAMAEALPVLSR
ncbi:hypothetical protein [Aureimonas sp. ME7]|uniref:hypothetical protein n=1 Tax=Aureimonas sp. ME7 TaxID=2744252 RepID=UPI0015F7281B|nr:hypothetical protein [Aureimonas sp. ME7]